MKTIEALLKRKTQLEDQLMKEKLRLHKTLDTFYTWGRGMRCTKVTPSFRKEDAIKEKLAIVEKLILNANK